MGRGMCVEGWPGVFDQRWGKVLCAGYGERGGE